MTAPRYDILGNEVTAGCLMAYTTACGDSQVLCLYRVIEVREKCLICKQVVNNKRSRMSERTTALRDPETRGIVIFFHEFKGD